MRIQRSAEHRIVPWANGLGITADVFLAPADSADWAWRVSIADVTDDVPFSMMPGIDRHIMVAQGVGMGLVIDGAAEVRMDRTSAPLAFRGEAITTCRLLDGPIADLNLMVRRTAGRGSLRAVRLRGGDTFVAAAGDVAVVVLDGDLDLARPAAAEFGDRLHTFDAILIEPTDGAVVLHTTSGAEFAVAEFVAGQR